MIHRCIIYLAVSLISLLSACSESKPDYDRAESVRRVMEVQRLQNLWPDDTNSVARIRVIVDSMGRSRKDACYFGAINVLIDRLFSDGRYAEADSLSVRMHREAFDANDSLSIAMAKRVRAQILFRLSQSDRALDEILSARSFAIKPLSSGSAFGTASSIEEWIHIIARENSDSDEMEFAGNRFADLADRYISEFAWPDSTAHYRVTSLAFKAENHLRANRLNQATSLLDSPSRLILTNLPARAYEHFYETRCRLRAKVGDFNGAIADVDTLLSTHRCFPWFYLRDLRLKAKVQNIGGRHEESAKTYSEYITYHDSLSKCLTDQRLHDLTLLYRSELDREERRANNVRMFALGCGSLLLLLLFCMTLRHAVKERKKNRLLVERIHEYDLAEQTLLEKISEPVSSEEELPPIARLDRHMLTARPYTDPGLGRKDLAEFLGMTQDAVAQLIRSEYDRTVHSYINSFRTEEVRRILDSDSGETIAEIASRLGFGTARTLQRAFKERFDMTPTQYKEAASSIRMSDNQ